jgi:hypothetical protein
MTEIKPGHEGEPPSAFAKFIQTYSTFLSTFVIGVAGLVATSIWQYRQGEISRQQAVTQTEMAREKARSDWRIARAEILAKNLDVLSDEKPASADKRFGVLLSLTRGDMIDAELAVSYALELGKASPVYMRTILGSTKDKNYNQLARAYVLTCTQRFGVTRPVDLCKDDQLEDRSQAIADLIRDEMEAQAQLGAAANPRSGPLGLLIDEDDVQRNASQLAWLFETYLQSIYEHRRWKEIERFEAFSPGARLVAALNFATARTGELLSEEEARQIADFHAQRRQWLASYVLGRKCDADCRARIIEFMLSTVEESEGQYDQVFKEVLRRPRSETGGAIAQIHTRLLWCQIDPNDVTLLRDRVLVPSARELVATPPKDPTILNDVVRLLALVPPPTDQAALAAYNAARADLRANARLDKLFATHEASARRQRTSPPPMIKRVNFCGVAESPDTSGADQRP